MTETTVPDICDIVRYNGDTFRVENWLKPAPPPKPEPVPSLEDLIAATEADKLAATRASLTRRLLAELRDEAHARNRMIVCTREEATHLSIYGVCGHIVAITEVEPTGKTVAWSEDTIREHREQAAQFIGQIVGW